MSLREYKAKRDFSRTREPTGKARTDAVPKAPIFVVQKHAASRLHYDFRLEMEGVLKSWAVPKGVPTVRGKPRLAVQVEDHPLEYGDFEGMIPEGSYGAGTVMLWDTGTYEVSGGNPLQALQNGKIHFSLRGQKLRGEWALVRTRSPDTSKPQWLLLKAGSDMSPLSAKAEDCSVLTRRSLRQIATGEGRHWHSDRGARRSRSTSRASMHDVKTRLPETPRLQSSTKLNRRRLPKSEPGFIQPMKALLTDQLPKGPDWVYEIKFDGIRALAVKDGPSLSLFSRTAKALGSKYPQITEALSGLPAIAAVLDGEVVALDPQGRPDFQLLQSYQNSTGKKPPLFYYVFDLLNLDRKDLTGLLLSQRKAAAESLVSQLGPVVRFSASIQADSDQVIREMQARGLEGLVAKRSNSKYEPGKRSGAWQKFKWSAEQEFVIGGYTEPQGGRSHFGAILVGYYENARLLFAGKVGTGFNEKLLQNLYTRFQKLARAQCPFSNLPENLPGSSRGLTAAQMRHCTWVEPKLVCQVRFAEWTRDHHLRQPAFLGLREDKDPKEVIRERPK